MISMHEESEIEPLLLQPRAVSIQISEVVGHMRRSPVYEFVLKERRLTVADGIRQKRMALPHPLQQRDMYLKGEWRLRALEKRV